MKRLTSLIMTLVAFIYGICEYTDIIDYSRSYKAHVVAVVDGDTITVSTRGAHTKIRLFGVDCPEKLQPYGRAATLLTQKLAYNKEVKITPIQTDRYGRTVAYVSLPGGNRLNYELVSNGLAWWSKQYAPEEMQLAIRELNARLKGRGLWQDEDPTPPWDFRKGVRH